MLSKKELIVQKLSSEPKPTTMKFVSEGPREFVEYNYDEILLDNIKEACTQHFKEKRNCDVLASEQGPSYTRLDQLPSSLNVCEHFGDCFNYNPVYFEKINHECVTVEEFLCGDFQKYINNDGSICWKDLEITKKAETLVHYTYEKSNNRLRITDLQRVRYHLYDPEIATQTIVDKKAKNQICL